MDLYEHRVTWVEPGQFGGFRELFLDETWGRLEAAGYRPLCLLNPVIGGMAEEVHSFVGYPSWDDWQRGQEIISGSADDDGGYREARRILVVGENIRARIAFSGRPLAVTPLEDRRTVYGVRRWTINPEMWERFTVLSHDFVWPAMDAMGHRVLGQFRDASLTNPLEVLNLAGYHSVGHWYETRFGRDPSSGVAAELRQLLTDGEAERSGLVRQTWVQLMNAHWPD